MGTYLLCRKSPESYEMEDCRALTCLGPCLPCLHKSEVLSTAKEHRGGLSRSPATVFSLEVGSTVALFTWIFFGLSRSGVCGVGLIGQAHFGATIPP